MGGDLNCVDQGPLRFWPGLVSAFLIFDNWRVANQLSSNGASTAGVFSYQISRHSGLCAHRWIGPTEGVVEASILRGSHFVSFFLDPF